MPHTTNRLQLQLYDTKVAAIAGSLHCVRLHAYEEAAKPVPLSVSHQSVWNYSHFCLCSASAADDPKQAISELPCLALWCDSSRVIQHHV